MTVETLALPRLGETMETGRVAGWLKKPGDSFRRGETIVEIESDKTVVELPALADGTLVEILAAEGSDIEVGAPLCTFDDGSGAADAAPPASGEAGGGTTQAVAAVENAVSEQPVEAAPVHDERPLHDEEAVSAPAAPATPDRGRIRATPLARRIARDARVDLQTVQGSGRRGRIEAKDVSGATAAAATSAGPCGGASLASRTWAAEGIERAAAVLLHGFGGDLQTWSGLAVALSRRGYRIVAPDLPGHGATTAEAPDLQAVIDAAVGFVAGLEGPIELVGHSLSGAAAIAAARALPDKVARLTLIAPAGLGTEIDADFIVGMARVDHPGTLGHLLRRTAFRPPTLSDAQRQAMATSLGAGRLAGLAAEITRDGRQTVDIVPGLRALAVPTRIVWGLEDRIIPWRHALAAPSRVALHFVPGAGHMPHWDQTGEVAALFD